MIIDKRQSYDSATIAVSFQVWVDIAAPIELVFNFLSKGEGLTRWWSTTCESEPSPGGALRFSWEGDNQTSGEAVFRHFDPPNRLTWEWTYHNQEPITCNGAGHRGMRWPAFCEFELATLSNQKTRVRLHDWGIDGGNDYRPIREATREGWVQAMNRLKKVCEMAFRELQARKVRRPVKKTQSTDSEPGGDDTLR